MKTLNFNLGLVSKYRSALMGIATIMIILCHAQPNDVVLPSPLLKVFEVGQTGVQLFFLLSGLGLYYSLSSYFNKPGNSLWPWYKKRYIRVLVPYLIIMIPIFSYLGYQNHSSVLDIFLKISTLGYWIGLGGAWFVSVLFLFYLIAPILFKWLSSKGRWYCFILLFLLTYIISAVYCSVDSTATIKHYIQAISSFPSFLLGMFIGPYIANSKQLSLVDMALIFMAILALFFGVFILTGSKEYWLFLLPLIVLACWFFEIVPNIIKPLAFLGGISLESYLFNVTLPSIFNLRGGGYWIAVVISIVLAYMVNIISKRLIRSFFRKTTNSK